MSRNVLPEHPTFFDAVGLEVLLVGGIFAQLYADWHTSFKAGNGGTAGSIGSFN
jgi:hypothetical protein